MERRKGKKEKEGEDLGRGRGGKKEGREGERGRALILEILEYPYNTVYDRWNEASMPKASCIHSVVSIQYRRVTDRQIDTRQHHQISLYIQWAMGWHMFRLQKCPFLWGDRSGPPSGVVSGTTVRALVLGRFN